MINPLLKRILCVEDDSQLRSILVACLSWRGFEVITAGDHTEALAQFSANQGHFQCVITDHHLPNARGFEVIDSLREANYQGPVILISGGIKDFELSEYYKRNIVAYLKKPFGLSALLDLVSKVARV